MTAARKWVTHRGKVGLLLTFSLAASMLAVTAQSSGAATNPAVHFDGSNDYVTFGDPAELDLASFTVETWFRRDGTGVGTSTSGIDGGGFTTATTDGRIIPLVAKGRSETDGNNRDMNYILGITTGAIGTHLGGDFEEGPGGTGRLGLNHRIVGTATILNNVWYHAALTYDGATLNLYLNGTLDATLAVNQPARSDSIQHASLGSALTSTGTAGGFFAGTIDEARIWNYARSGGEILAARNTEITTDPGGLVARWGLGEDTGTTAGDSISPASNGTLTNGPTWIESFPIAAGMSAPDPPALVGPSDASTGNSTSPTLEVTATDPDGGSLAVAFYGRPLASGVFSLIGTAPGVISGTNASTTWASIGDDQAFEWYATVSDGVDTTQGTTWTFRTALRTGASSIDLGSSGAYVTFGDPAKLDLANFTIETWFMRTGAGVVGSTGTGGISKFIPLVTHGGPESEGSNLDANWLLGIDGATGVIAADFEEGPGGGGPAGLNHPLKGTTVIAQDEWHHAATTYDGATLKIYLDGGLEGSLAVNAPTRSDTIQHAALGAMMRSTGNPANTARFDGLLDETRVWDRALGEVELGTNINLELTSGLGLAARWGMNEGSGTSVRDSVTTAANGTTVGSGAGWAPGEPFDVVILDRNTAPDAPTLVAPSDGETGVSTSPTLHVDVSDPDGDPVTTTFFGRSNSGAPGEDFTFVVLPDTQHYVDTDETNAATYTQQTQWIVDNENALNVAFVSHLGDVAESFDDPNTEIEWQRADAAQDILDNNRIPNNLAPGNHDMSSRAVTSNFFDQYFPPSRYDLPQNPWYGGWLGEEAGQIQRLNKNNYELFTAGGIDFLIIHLEIDMPTYAVAWANEIIGRYPNRQVIISTHAFLNGSALRRSSLVTGRINGLSASQVWDQLINPNCNVFLVVNGHYPGEARTTTNNSCGQPVHQVVTDYQSRANGGDGWLRYYTFKPATNEIKAVTYSPKLDRYETDASSRFTLAYDMTELGGFAEIGSTTTPSGSTASVPWTGLDPDSEYEWYAVADDGSATVSSRTWSFTPAAPPP